MAAKKASPTARSGQKRGVGVDRGSRAAQPASGQLPLAPAGGLVRRKAGQTARQVCNGVRQRKTSSRPCRHPRPDRADAGWAGAGIWRGLAPNPAAPHRAGAVRRLSRESAYRGIPRASPARQLQATPGDRSSKQAQGGTLWMCAHNWLVIFLRISPSPRLAARTSTPRS